MAPKEGRGKETGSAGTLKARTLAPQDSTDEFEFYLDDIAPSHRRVMEKIEGALLDLLVSQAPKGRNGKTLFKRPNGKLYTPQGTLTFQIKVMPNKESPEEDVMRLLFRWVDLYFIGFRVKDTWYLFEDDDSLVVPLPPVRPGVKGQVKEVPWSTTYGDIGPQDVKVGPRAIKKLYEILMDIETNFRKDDDPNTRSSAWSSFKNIELSLPAVIFSEALRFPALREWVSRRLEAGDIDESLGTPVPAIFTRDFNEWSSNSGPMFQEIPRPHQKYFALLGILKREADTVVPYKDPQHMRNDTSERSNFDGKAKAHLNVVVIGHLNSGKSTTFGHLIHMKGCIDKCVVDKCEKEAAEMNKSTCRYAWLFDKLKSERAKEMSIDLAVSKLETEKHVWTVLDAPGHTDFIKNMIAGTSQAECAVLIVDSTAFEVGISIDGQTHEHALIAHALGATQMICCCNKMDATTPKYSKERYEEVKKEVSSCLKKLGYKPADIPFVPISGLEGDNMIKRSVNMGWYEGLTLLEALDAVSVPQLPMDALAMDKRPLRFPLRRKFEKCGVGTVSVGCVQAGVLMPKMKVKYAPTSLKGGVRSVQLHHELVQMALPRDSVGLHTRGIAVGDLNCGYVVSDSELYPAQEAASFVARIIICHQLVTKIGKIGKISKGYTPVMHCHTSQTTVRFVELVAKLDRKYEIVQENPAWLEKGRDIWLVKMIPLQPVVVETFEQYPQLGRFVLRDQGKTIGYGVIMSVERKERYYH